MAPGLISLEEYMHTSYSPDCEYIDGVVLERNVGKRKHAYTQGKLYRRLDEFVEELNLLALVEQRIQVSSSRVRVPDVCVVAANEEEVITEPPLLCVEVFSPDDRWSRMNSSVSDYQAMGVPCVWVVDPYRRQAWVFDLEQPPMELAGDSVLRANTLGVEVRLDDVLPPIRR